MGQLLAIIESQTQKTCDKDVGGCGTHNVVRKRLERPPSVFSVHLAWPEPVTAEEINSCVATIDESIQLGEWLGVHASGWLFHSLAHVPQCELSWERDRMPSQVGCYPSHRVVHSVYAPLAALAKLPCNAVSHVD